MLSRAWSRLGDMTLQTLEKIVGALVYEIRKSDPNFFKCPPPVPTPIAAVSPLSITTSNQSTMITDAEIASAIAAFQAQYAQDFVPIWGEPAPKTYAFIFVDEDPNAPGALGYHDLEGDVPTARILVKTTKQAGISVSSVVSHEGLEMLGDPYTSLVVIDDPNGDGKSGMLYMAELCDAVEQTSYMLDGVEVSNFVTPAWFDPDNAKGPYDKLGKLTLPLQLLPGGSYIGYLIFTSAQGWQSKQARNAPKPQIVGDRSKSAYRGLNPVGERRVE
jgi:hypothetical protein